jgi:hypothetical protein
LGNIRTILLCINFTWKKKAKTKLKIMVCLKYLKKLNKTHQWMDRRLSSPVINKRSQTLVGDGLVVTYCKQLSVILCVYGNCQINIRIKKLTLLDNVTEKIH